MLNEQGGGGRRSRADDAEALLVEVAQQVLADTQSASCHLCRISTPCAGCSSPSRSAASRSPSIPASMTGSEGGGDRRAAYGDRHEPVDSGDAAPRRAAPWLRLRRRTSCPLGRLPIFSCARQDWSGLCPLRVGCCDELFLYLFGLLRLTVTAFLVAFAHFSFSLFRFLRKLIGDRVHQEMRFRVARPLPNGRS